MCIYTVKGQKKFIIKKNPQRGCATTPNVPKLGVSVVKDTANTNNFYKVLLLTVYMHIFQI